MHNASSHTAAATRKFMVAKSIMLVDHPPYSPNLAPVAPTLGPEAKAAISGISISSNSIKTCVGGGSATSVRITMLLPL